MKKKYDENKINDIFKQMRSEDLDFQKSVIEEYKKKRQLNLVGSITVVLLFSVLILNLFFITNIDLKIKKEYIDIYIAKFQYTNDFDYSKFYTSEHDVFKYQEVEDYYSVKPELNDK